MKQIKNGEIVYRVWSKDSQVYGSKYVFVRYKDLDNVYVVDDQNKLHIFKSSVLILDRDVAILKYKTLQEKYCEQKKRNVYKSNEINNSSLNKKNPLLKFRYGTIYYIVSNTKSGAKMTAYKIQKFHYDKHALSVISEDGIKKTIYENQISELLQYDEAIKKYNNYKKIGPYKYVETWTLREARCYNCGNILDKSKMYYCSKCGGYKCDSCGHCFC